jgi:hypothetical protein
MSKATKAARRAGTVGAPGKLLASLNANYVAQGEWEKTWVLERNALQDGF